MISGIINFFIIGAIFERDNFRNSIFFCKHLNWPDRLFNFCKMHLEIFPKTIKSNIFDNSAF